MRQRTQSMIVFVVIASLALAGCGPKAAATQAATGGTSATVSDIVNTVLGRPAAEGDYAQVSSGFVLQIGGGVKTEDNSSAKLAFTDGSVVRVAPNSSFTLKSSTTSGGVLTTLQLELGKIFVYVAGGTVQVDTPVGVASVRGSWAAFTYDPGDPNDPNDDRLIIECVEGDCEAHNANGSLDLGTFQSGVLTLSGPGDVTTFTGTDLQSFFANNPDVATALAATLTAAAPGAAATATATATESNTPEPRATATDTPEPTLTPTSTPAGVSDTDGDGVPNGLDRCPTTRGPASNNGCPVPPTTCYTLTISNQGLGQAFGSGANCPDGSGRYRADAVVTLGAFPNPGESFNFWGGDASGPDNPTSITMDSDKTVYANFSSPGMSISNLNVSYDAPTCTLVLTANITAGRGVAAAQVDWTESYFSSVYTSSGGMSYNGATGLWEYVKTGYYFVPGYTLTFSVTASDQSSPPNTAGPVTGPTIVSVASPACG